MFPSEFGTWNESGNKNRRGVVSLPVLVIRIAKARGKKKKEFDRETVAQHTVK
jgi:hypothetical protein